MAVRRPSTLRSLIVSMRPKQWLKNAFVLTGIVFSGRAFEFEADIRALGAFVAFCAVSSAMYLLNDVADRATDRLNPRTASRPIATGALSSRTAIVAALALCAGALALGTSVNWQTVTVLAGFIVLQVLYSTSLKHLLLIDVMAIATGFVLRALAGIVAIDGVLSPWLLLEAGMLSLFRGLTKRRGEVVALAGAPPSQRRVLAGYSVKLLDELISVTTPTILIVYAIYCVLGARSPLMLVTVPFVLYGIFRVVVMMQKDPGMTEDPSTIAWQDRPLLVCIAIWAVIAGTITVYTS